MAHPLDYWRQQLPTWTNRLQTNIHDLVQPGTARATQYPHLHEAFAGRLDEAWIARHGEQVSLCDEHYTLDNGNAARADADEFQAYVNHGNELPYENAEYRLRNMCRVLKGRMTPYANIGGGS